MIATSLRIPEARNAYLKRKAKEIGVSQNALIMMLLDIGIRCYEEGLKANVSDCRIWKDPDAERREEADKLDRWLLSNPMVHEYLDERLKNEILESIQSRKRE